MKYFDKKIIYTASLILGLGILAICFIFRYSYIDFLGFDRPLKLACFINAILGTIASLIAIIDGVNKHFRGNILLLAILNLIMAFSYPILMGAEIILAPIENPYITSAPDKGNTTKFRRDSSFIIEGEIYKFPLSLKDFEENGFSYSLKEQNKELVATISRMGKSFDPKPTWFTDGMNKEIYREFYLLEAFFDPNIDKENIDNTPIRRLNAAVINNNRDFEIMGIKLEDSIYDIKNNFKDKLKEDENNTENTIKSYYLETNDNYTIKLNALNGVVQSIEIY